MPRHIAFLRAINVGGRTVKMEHLRHLFAAMGFVGVETFIASGNVIFDAAETNPATLERTIEAGLEAALGYRVDTFIRAPAELAAVAAHWPFAESEAESAYTLFIAFLAAAPDETARRRLYALATDVDAFNLSGREVYWLRRDALGESSITGAALERALGMPATIRNSRTVTKLAARYAAAE